MGVIVRRPAPNDLDALRALHDAVLPVQYETEFFESAVLEERGVRTWVAVLDGELVGFITLRFSLDVESTEALDLLSPDGCWPTGREVAYILTLGVCEAQRRRGIAASLVDEALAQAQASSLCCLVYLHVLTSNDTALAFYNSRQFRNVRREEKCVALYPSSLAHSLGSFYVIRGSRAPTPGLEQYDAYALCRYLKCVRCRSRLAHALTRWRSSAAASRPRAGCAPPGRSRRCWTALRVAGSGLLGCCGQLFQNDYRGSACCGGREARMVAISSSPMPTGSAAQRSAAAEQTSSMRLSQAALSDNVYARSCERM